MKLTQRLVLAYYKNKLKLLERISPRRAAEEAFRLFCTPYTRRKKYDAPPIFKKSGKLNFTLDREVIHGFQWLPEKSNGHKVLICHGFDSYSYRFDRYVEPLLLAGFEVLAFDAPAHGLSSGKTINAAQYRDMVIEVSKRYGPIHGLISHSFGGLAVALAIEKIPDNQYKRLVLMAPATESTTAISHFFTYVSVSDAVKKEFHDLINEMGGNPASWFSVARAMQNVTTPTLWVHDKEDAVTPFADVEHLLALNLPHLHFEITSGLGHSNVYRDEKVSKKVIQYMESMLHD